MVGPTFQAHFHPWKGHRADPFGLVLAQSQSYCEFRAVFFYQPFLQRTPTTSDVEDAGNAIGPRLLNVVLELPFLCFFEGIGLLVIHGAGVTKLAIEK